jgi:hypothetical protein
MITPSRFASKPNKQKHQTNRRSEKTICFGGVFCADCVTLTFAYAEYGRRIERLPPLNQ